MKLKSFGCSFVYGSDLPDVSEKSLDHSHLTWPALIAKEYDLPYECYAAPGIGNLKILCDIVSQASLDDPALFLINWTWIDRFDFVNDLEQWETMRPAVETEKTQAYYRYFYSQIKDMIESVYRVNTAVDFLNERKIPFVMTYMDHNLLTPVDPNWHDPTYISIMQNKIKLSLADFQGKNFLDWSRDQGFGISNNWHPGEAAHRAAAEYLSPRIGSIIQNYQKEK
jgi:hypothetical protein